MIIFETPQSSRSKIKVTLERLEAELPDVDVDEIRLLNPYNMLITIPSESFRNFSFASFSSSNTKFYESRIFLSIFSRLKYQNAPKNANITPYIKKKTHFATPSSDAGR